MANAVEGRSGRAIERDMARYARASANVGTAMHSRHAARDIEHLATVVLRNLEADDMVSPVPALAIASDFSILLDPATILSVLCAGVDV